MSRQAHAPSPFFLYLAFTNSPCQRRSEAQRHGGARSRSLCPRNLARAGKGKAAMITRMDADVGRSDGETSASWASTTKPSSSSPATTGRTGREASIRSSSQCRPAARRKRSLHDGGIREPMLVRWPGKIAAGRTSDLPWAFSGRPADAGPIGRG